MRSESRSPSRRGFTLVELLVVMALIAIISTLSAPNFLRLVHRSKLTGFARQSESLMRLARQYSIRHNTPAVVRIDTASEEIIAFVDIDGVNAGDPSDRIFNPVAGRPTRSTDFEVARYRLPNSVDFDGPTADPYGHGAVSDFTPVATENVAVFRPNGSVVHAGAFRLADKFGNYLELRVDPPISGRIQVRKFSDVDLKWHLRNETGKPWKWN